MRGWKPAIRPGKGIVISAVYHATGLKAAVANTARGNSIAIVRTRPIRPVGRYPAYKRPKMFHSRIVHDLISLPVINRPAASYTPSALPIRRRTLLTRSLPY